MSGASVNGGGTDAGAGDPSSAGGGMIDGTASGGVSGGTDAGAGQTGADSSTCADRKAELRRQATQLGWYHSIDLGQGVVTPGFVGLSAIEDRHFPPLAGRDVLDVGAWDGANSFRAERLGARRVVALDHYVWGVDLDRRQHYWDECAARGELPDHTLDETEFWDGSLPGRRGFDLAREVLGSAVEPVVADFMTTDLDALGCFDVVLYLGVLYHMREPLTALERVRRVTKGVAVIETEALEVRGHHRDPLVAFLAGNDLRRDFGNWYLPSQAALHALCKAAGFSRVETHHGWSGPRATARRLLRRRAHYRILVHAYP